MDLRGLKAELNRPGSLLASVLDTIFDGVYIVDRTRRIIFWNRGAEEITSYSRSEVLGRKCRDGILNHIDENGTLLCHHACPLIKTLSRGDHVCEIVYPLHKTGRRFPVSTHVAPIKDRNGKIIAGIEVFRDISLEEDFRILQEKFNDLIKKYVSNCTMEDIMDRLKTGAKGESRLLDLTIMFVDIVGFTGISEKSAPADVVKMLNGLFDPSCSVIGDCHGDVDKFIGDCFMATFKDANDAVDAAKRLLAEVVPGVNRTRASENKEPLSVRIGINSGVIIMGDVGSEARKDNTIIGDAVNTASRIQSECAPCDIAISEATWSRLNDPGSFVFYKNIVPKGKKQSISIYSLKS